MTKTNKIILSILLLLVSLPLFYSFYWFRCTGKIKDYLEKGVLSISQEHDLFIKHISRDIEVSGFPFEVMVKIKDPEFIVPTSDILDQIEGSKVKASKKNKYKKFKKSSDSIAVKGEMILHSDVFSKEILVSVEDDLFLTTKADDSEYKFLIKNEEGINLSLKHSGKFFLNFLKEDMVSTENIFADGKSKVSLRVKTKDIKIYEFDSKKQVVDLELFDLYTKGILKNKGMHSIADLSFYLEEKMTLNKESKDIFDNYPYFYSYDKYGNLVSVVDTGTIDNHVNFDVSAEGLFDKNKGHTRDSFNLSNLKLKVKDLNLSNNLREYKSKGEINVSLKENTSFSFNVIWDDISSSGEKKYKMLREDAVSVLDDIKSFYSENMLKLKAQNTNQADILVSLSDDLISLSSDNIRKIIPAFHEMGDRELSVDLVSNYSLVNSNYDINIHQIDYKNKDFGFNVSGKIERNDFFKGFLMFKISDYKEFTKDTHLYLEKVSPLLNSIDANVFELNITDPFEQDMVSTLKIFAGKRDKYDGDDISISLESNSKEGKFSIGNMDYNSSVVTLVSQLGKYFIVKKKE